jgi:integrase
MEYALRVQKGAALRVSQLLSLRKSDLQPDEDGSWLLFLRKDKRATMKSNREALHTKSIDGDTVDAFHEAAVLSCRKTIFKSITKKDIGKIVKKTAKRFKFPDNMTWDGSHINRHAGTAALQRRILDQMLDHASQMSSTTRRHYARSLKSRMN